MKDIVVITGTSCGIGQATARRFLAAGYTVHGLDVQPASIEHEMYIHHVVDITRTEKLPEICGVSILINNAGIQTPSLSESFVNTRDIEVNLVALINCTQKYAIQQPESIQAVVNLASVSAHNGAEFGEYVASKGGVLSYTKWTAKQLAPFGATVNSLSFGGVSTELNRPVMDDPHMWDAIMSQTPMRKWMSPEEAADWVYFMAVTNKSCTGQDVIVDNGEMMNHTFIWSA